MSGFVRNPRLDRLARLGRLFAHLTTLLLVLLVAGELGIWLREDWVRAAVLPRIGLPGTATLGPWVQTLGLLLTAVPLLALAYGLLQVRRIFQDFATGRMITPTLARRLELFGGTVLAQAFLSPLAGAALSVVVTAGNPSGQRMLALSIGSQDMLCALFGVLLIGVGLVMHEAARIAEDHAGFV
ncbi:hypothetical protein ABLE91_09995 [Aquabacter sp. CN5-332]|uniref:hypothetical protein n=1 Tax=Aquabacter sp. CN5-332 TaxID=3156608 RepID=UPI0032B44B7B